MTPTENDLRAALHRDEGDGLDPDAVISAGRARQTQRRGRVAAVTGATVGVLAVATAGGLLLSRSGSDHSTNSASRADAGGAKAAASAPSSQAGGLSAKGSAGSSAPARSSTTASCPSTFPAQSALGGGRPGDSSQSLFASPVTSVVVCGYGNTGSGVTVHPSTLVLRGSDATRLVASLESASASRPPGMCPTYRVAEDHRLVFVGVTSDGSGLAPVSTTLGNPSCTVQVSNGSTVRYAWEPPTDLRTRLFALRPTR